MCYLEICELIPKIPGEWLVDIFDQFLKGTHSAFSKFCFLTGAVHVIFVCVYVCIFIRTLL